MYILNYRDMRSLMLPV